MPTKSKLSQRIDAVSKETGDIIASALGFYLIKRKEINRLSRVSFVEYTEHMNVKGLGLKILINFKGSNITTITVSVFDRKPSEGEIVHAASYRDLDPVKAVLTLLNNNLVHSKSKHAKTLLKDLKKYKYDRVSSTDTATANTGEKMKLATDRVFESASGRKPELASTLSNKLQKWKFANPAKKDGTLIFKHSMDKTLQVIIEKDGNKVKATLKGPLLAGNKKYILNVSAKGASSDDAFNALHDEAKVAFKDLKKQMLSEQGRELGKKFYWLSGFGGK